MTYLNRMEHRFSPKDFDKEKLKSYKGDILIVIKGKILMIDFIL